MAHVINMFFNANLSIHMCVYIILQCPLAKHALVKYVIQVPILLLCLITSYNKGISTCVTYFTDSNTTKNCWYWPDTDIQIPGIGAALASLPCAVCCHSGDICQIALCLLESMGSTTFSPTSTQLLKVLYLIRVDTRPCCQISCLEQFSN